MSFSFAVRKWVVCWWVAVAGSAVALGQPFSPQGGEYAIAGSLPGDQTLPQTSINSGGGYLVWCDNSVVRSGLRIRAGRLGSDLTISGSPFNVSSRVKSTTIGNQQNPRVALLPGSGAVFVWQETKNAGARQIYARFIGPNGSFVGGDVRISPDLKYNRTDPCVASLADGSVVIAWTSDGEDGDMKGVFARHFSSMGKALGGEFVVNQYYLNNQRSPAVAVLANGNLVFAWISELQRSASSVDVYASIFDSSGTRLTPEFPVNTSTNSICANPSVAASPQGGFAVAWSYNNTPILTAGSQAGVTVTPAQTVPSTNGWDVFGRLFDANGAPTTAPFLLNQYTYGDQFAPRLATLGTNYMAVWTSLSQTNSLGQVDPWEGVYGQFFDGGGNLAVTNDLHVNTTTFGRQIQPTVAGDGASRFLVVWSSVVPIVGRFDFDLFGQIYQQTTP